MPRTLSLAILLALPVLARGQANAIVPDPDPEIERKSFIVAPGFEVNLFAGDPLLAKPIQMNFDPQGRLWVATSEIYPQISPGQKANDKIIVLEDKDGDGKADSTTVFADGLLIPTGIEPGDGGAYVANSTELIHLSASKPGGKADRTRVLFSGFGTEDTHHIIHTFRWGPDCALYFNQSIYIHSHIETPHGVRRLNGGGIWRYRPEQQDLRVFAFGWVNTWGHHFDKYGQSFVTDGAGGEGINHAIPGGAYMWAVGHNRILHGLNPGSPKHCGLEIVSGRHLPDDWQGSMVTNDFRGHRVCRFTLRDAGSSYESREQQEVIKTNHPAFRPIDVKMGPDGAIYVADWYNPIIQHGEVDFRDPRRDHVHGRIWRITAKGRPLVPKPNLVGASVPELLEYLKSPEGWTRQQAKRVLKERSETAAKAELVQAVQGWPIRIEPGPALAKWYESIPATDERTRLEAGWVYQSLGIPAPHNLDRLLTASDPGVRAAAVRIVASYRSIPGRNLIAWLEKAVTDASPRVRLEAVRALATPVAAEDMQAAELALRVLDQPMDPTLDYALWLTLRELDWLPAFARGELNFGGDIKKLAFAIEASGKPEAVKPLVALIRGGKVPKESLHAFYLLLAKTGGPAELAMVLDRAAVEQGLPAGQRAELARVVEESVRLRKVGVPPDLTKFRLLLDSPERAARLHAARLTGLWKVEKLRPDLERVGKLPVEAYPNEAAAALEGLALFGDAKAKTFLIELACHVERPDVRRLAVVALAGVDLPAATREAVDLFASAKRADELIDVFAALVRQKGGPVALTTALVGKKLPADVAKVGLKAIRASGQPHTQLVEALTKAGNLTAARKEPTADEVRSYVADVLKSGDPARGELVYRRKELQCLNCHAIGGVGGQVGPDMTSIGASAQPDYLVESMLIPNKAVKEGYHAVQVTDANGKVVTGVKVRDTEKEIVLRTAEDKEVVIPKADIDGPVKQSPSLMPVGMTDQLTRGEFVDLVRFLSELGKVGPYSLSKARLVRRWEVLDPGNANLNLIRRSRVSATAETPTQFSWSPAYAVVAGELPAGELPTFVVWNQSEPQTVARFRIDATAGGPVKLKFESVAGLTLFVGASGVEAKPETTFDVKPGATFVNIVVDRNKRTEGLRVELQDVAGSPARAMVAGGK